MGFFDGMFNSQQHASFSPISYDQKVGTDLKGEASVAGNGALSTDNQLATGGQTPADAKGFASNMANSAKQFGQATGNANPQQAGQQNPAARMSALAQTYQQMLQKGQLQHNLGLMNTRDQQGVAGFNAGQQLAGQGDQVVNERQNGLVDGLGTRLTAAGIKGGITAIGSWLGGPMGGQIAHKIGSDAVADYDQPRATDSIYN